jgi:hypothetical protein
MTRLQVIRRDLVLITVTKKQMVASKFLDDFYYSNKHWAEIGGISTSELNGLELEFLFRIAFSCSIRELKKNLVHTSFWVVGSLTKLCIVENVHRIIHLRDDLVPSMAIILITFLRMLIHASEPWFFYLFSHIHMPHFEGLESACMLPLILLYHSEISAKIYANDVFYRGP